MLPQISATHNKSIALHLMHCKQCSNFLPLRVSVPTRIIPKALNFVYYSSQTTFIKDRTCTSCIRLFNALPTSIKQKPAVISLKSLFNSKGVQQCPQVILLKLKSSPSQFLVIILICDYCYFKTIIMYAI